MKQSRIKFKQYNQDQLMVLPPRLDDLINQNHPVRVVNHIINQIDLDPVLHKYQGGGASSYHPRMLLKVLVYGYLCNIYSSRKLESATRENIYFMWLAGMEQPDHNTINRFRSERLKGVIQKVFSQVVLLMVESGHVDLQRVYTDGTKIESCANRYTFVWGKAIKTRRERIIKQLDELWAYTQEIAAAEMQDNAPTRYEATDPEEIRKAIEEIDLALKDKPVSEKVKQKLKYAKKNWPEKMKQYEQQEQILGERNSFSKTDPDATFMRMKEDHMLNGQLKPGYNTQISTNQQIIVNYSIHQNPNDTKTLKPHMESFEELYGTMPAELVADAGYGSEENFEYLDQNQIEAFVKYTHFDKEQKGRSTGKEAFYVDNLFYNKELDCYFCPMGQKMIYIGTKLDRTKSGYQKELALYRAQNCEGCPLRGSCYKTHGNRVIEVSHRGNELKQKVKIRLLSEKGLAHCRQRPVDVEPVFGMIKFNRGFKRFLLRGLEKVTVEFGLIAIAHNLMKLTLKGI